MANAVPANMADIELEKEEAGTRPGSLLSKKALQQQEIKRKHAKRRLEVDVEEMEFMKQMKLQELEEKREKIALDEQDDLWEQEAAGRPNFTDTYMGLERIDISRSPLVIGRSREVVRQGDRVEPTGTSSRR